MGGGGSEGATEFRTAPTLAPRIMGTAASRLTVPDPTNATIVEVVTEDDCTSTVARMPAASPAKGFDTPLKIPSAAPAPASLIPLSSSLMATRKR